MANELLQVSDDFWNIRGSFRIGGLLDIGTQCSLVRRHNGKFVFLDAYMLSGSVRREVDRLTHGGEDVEAILNLHPFHTVHVEKLHEQYPNARLYGTARHVGRFPGLDWQRALTESPELHAAFADDFDFSVPQGVDFISDNENVHFSSVLALHRASRTLHADDTLMYLRLPAPLRWFGPDESVAFHPTLAKALERRAGAATDFRAWARALIDDWQDAENLCAAHNAALLARDNRGAPLPDRLQKALDRVRTTLDTHQRKFG
ncbi:MAG: hypothetical protein RQ826_04545 [Xanthomonadales bacterium]|nr:hypothetical protein [Xanthomonadales bacterium]